jgi:hypothetical protein
LPENKARPFILSFIIDIAEASHCQLPWKGTQSSFKDPFHQTLVGVKEHGYGVHLFPNINTVRKGANLTLYCIDYVIEQWKRRHGYYPTEIDIQIDGGPENANDYVLHHCEHLVAKRMARRVRRLGILMTILMAASVLFGSTGTYIVTLTIFLSFGPVWNKHSKMRTEPSVLYMIGLWFFQIIKYSTIQSWTLDYLSFIKVSKI